MNRALLATVGLVVGLVAAGQSLPDAYAKKKLDPAARKAKRLKVWAKYNGEKKNGMPFKGLDYYVDKDKLDDTRWGRSDRAAGPENFVDGHQLSATWQTPNSEGWAISIYIHKWEQKNSAKRTKGVFPFENIGKQADIADVGKMSEYMYEDWLAGSKDVIKDALKKPGKARSSGPAKHYASATATDAETKQRQRRDWYFWTGPNCTYMALVKFDQAVLNKDEITDKAKDFMKAIKEIKDKID